MNRQSGVGGFGAVDLQRENALLREALSAANERARLAEEQLLRVHRAVRAAKQDARRGREGPTPVGSRVNGQWNGADPTLDDRLEAYLRNDLEPDRSRDWILGGRSA